MLLFAQVPFVENSECVRRFGPSVKIHPTYLCAGGVNKTDNCKGDSGGPIQSYGLINGRSRMVLFGVVLGKFSINCRFLVNYFKSYAQAELNAMIRALFFQEFTQMSPIIFLGSWTTFLEPFMYKNFF